MEFEVVGRTIEHGKKSGIQTWTDAGYSVFSAEGPASIQIERIARSLNKNKSSFYYFFKDRDSFLECLMKEHLSRLQTLADEIREIHVFDPEFFKFLIKYKEEFFFQIQLSRNRETELFDTVLNVFNSRVSAAILPVWSDYLDAPMNVSDILWGMSRDTLYCRATAKNFDIAWLMELARGVKLIVNIQNSQAMAV